MITIVYACDNSYVRQTLISMVSVVMHNQNVKFYLIADRLSTLNKELISSIMQKYEIAICYLDVDSVLPELDLDEADRHPRTIYTKLFLSEAILEDRVLYLDSDTVVKESLESLFNRKMDCELVAGVMMPYSSKIKNRVFAQQGQPYICDGIVLINMQLWRKERISDICKQFISEHRGKPPMLSEGTLNHVCQGKIGILEPKYNLMPSMIMYSMKQMIQLFKADCYYQNEDAMQHAKSNPVVIHFMKELYNRPWFTPCEHPFLEEYRNIEKRVFGENKTKHIPLTWHTRITVLMKKKLPFKLFAAMYHLKNKED